MSNELRNIAAAMADQWGSDTFALTSLMETT